jgi:hypothetical protein
MARSARLPARLPLLAAAVLIAVATAVAVFLRLPHPNAITPWESAISMEGVRLNVGLPIYKPPHATHMYGPLLTVAIAGVFRVTGLSIPSARIALSLPGLALAFLLARIFLPRRCTTELLGAALLFYATCFRADLNLSLVQPDGIALLLASVAILLWAKRQSGWAAISLVAAMLFKQTAAAFSVIPLIYLAIWKRPVLPREALRALLLPGCATAVLAAIAWLWPAMFHAIVVVPASIKVYPDRAPCDCRVCLADLSGIRCSTINVALVRVRHGGAGALGVGFANYSAADFCLDSM